MNKKVFKIKDENGQDVELAIKKPTGEIRVKSQLVYNRSFREALETGSILKRNLDSEATKLGLWDENKQKEVEDLQKQHRDLEAKLRSGAYSFETKEEARKCALEMRKLRWKIMEVARSKDDLYSTTAESYADEARLKYFISQCCIYNDTGKTYYKSYDDFLSQSESEIAKQALSNYFELMVDEMGNIENDWMEIQWLKNNGYMNDKNQLIDSNGRAIDEDSGLFIDDKGRFINSNNEYIDIEGRLLDEDGNLKVEFKSWE